MVCLAAAKLRNPDINTASTNIETKLSGEL